MVRPENVDPAWTMNATIGPVLGLADDLNARTFRVAAERRHMHAAAGPPILRLTCSLRI